MQPPRQLAHILPVAPERTDANSNRDTKLLETRVSHTKQSLEWFPIANFGRLFCHRKELDWHDRHC